MTEYKDTLNLPNTKFPMKANLAQREPEMLKQWHSKNIYKQICEQRQGQKKFILHDGPPYANGALHQGHALNKILKDIVVKSRLLDGYESPYVPGWDCHGLPIEVNVEKKIGKVGKVTKGEFFKACRDYAAKQVEIQKQGFQRLGVLGEWDNPYLTMNYSYEANVMRSLAKIIENGHLVHGKKPVHWCIACGSALAEAEVEYKDKASPAIDVSFKVIDNAEIDADITTDIIVPIWTTTPWTLPANQAVAVNPKFTYVLVQTPNAYFIVVKDLLASVMQRYDITDYKVVKKFTGDELENIKLQHPFLPREVPIILADHVTVEAGTGNVHTAPGHGQDDYVVASRYDLLIENPVDNRGVFLPDTPFVGGEKVFDANEHIVEILRERGNLLHLETIEHSYPHCWRHKTALIFRATPQWFISMDKNGLRQKAMAEIDKVTWLPDWGKARITSMVEQRPDWCISRQRLWGTPMPLFIHTATGELHPDTLILIEQVAKKVEKHGIEVWSELTAEDLLGVDAKDYEKIADTLDVWFDSGVTHACVLAQRKELQLPADIYLEGSDQHRGWFQSSLLTAVAMYGHVPFKTVLTHGHVLDADGRKMSKSLGNVISPEKIANNLGADILRLWVASADYSGDINCSDESLKRTADAYRRIRNTARYFLANLNDFNYANDAVPFGKMLALDKWAVDTTRLMQAEIQEAYTKYQFSAVYHKLHNFCNVTMGSFYLDIIKDRQYTMKQDSLARRSAQTAMYHILQALVRWIMPILSFTAEEIWQYIEDKKLDSVFFSTWYEGLPALGADDLSQEYWQQLIDIRNEVNKELEQMRNQSLIGSALQADVTLYANAKLLKQLKLIGDELRFVFITASAKILPEAEKPHDAKVALPGLWLKVVVSKQQKCVRCWHCCEDVGSNSEHPELCCRCIENAVGQGEERLYA